jgi:hypothetical protein
MLLLGDNRPSPRGLYVETTVVPGAMLLMSEHVLQSIQISKYSLQFHKRPTRIEFQDLIL